MEKLETCLRRSSKRFLNKLFMFFLNVCFGSKIAPRGYFGTKNSGIDAESARESENTTKTPQKPKVFEFFLKLCFGPLPDPFGSFGTKKDAIDVENAKESENRAKTPKKSENPFLGRSR